MTPNPPSAERILVVDDEPEIVALVAYHLAKAGYRVSTAASGPDALDIARRDSTRDVAVLMLTARREEPDRIRGLSLGADDYLTKPFSPQELVLRIGAILRRAGAASPVGHDGLTIGALRIDKSAMTVVVEDQSVELTPTEFKLLLTLAERRGRVQARGHLLETVWEAAPDIQTRTVDMHIQRLRTKLGAAGDMIETVRGFGYRLRAATGRGA